MPKLTPPTDPAPRDPAPRIAARIAPGHRALYVSIPAPIFNHAKAQAYLSDMRWSEYIQRLLAEAAPYIDEGGAGHSLPAH